MRLLKALWRHIKMIPIWLETAEGMKCQRNSQIFLKVVDNALTLWYNKL